MESRYKGIQEETIKRLFISAVNQLLADRDEILANFEAIKQVLFDTADLDMEHAKLQNEMAVVAEMVKKCVDENAHIAQSQDEYLRRYEGLVHRFETVKNRFKEVGGLITETKARQEMVEAFIDSLKKQDCLITVFDEQLWYGLVDYATICSEDDVRFAFKDGMEISQISN